MRRGPPPPDPCPGGLRTEGPVGDSPAPTGDAAPEHPEARRAIIPAPTHPPVLIPQHRTRSVPAWWRIFRLLQEAGTERRNLIPFGLIVGLALLGLGLLAQPRPAPPPDPSLVHFAVASSYSGTSLFGNGRYLGEIGPQGRDFTVSPGHLRLRVIHSYCHAAETAFDFKAGERHTIGNLDPACERP